MLASPKPNSTLISRIFRKTLYSMEKVSFFCLVAIAGPVNAKHYDSMECRSAHSRR